MLRELYTKLKSAAGIVAQNATATVNGASVNVADYGSALFLASIGNSADTLSGSVYIEVQVEESDDDSVWAAAADADVINAVTGSATGTVAKIDAPAEDQVVVKAAYKGYKKYARCVVKFTGTHTNGTPIAVVNLLGHPELLPV